MKLYWIEAIKSWTPWYDTTLEMVVQARDTKQARRLASGFAGAEGKAVWLDPTKTQIRQLVAEGEPGVLIVNNRSTG